MFRLPASHVRMRPPDPKRAFGVPAAASSDDARWAQNLLRVSVTREKGVKTPFKVPSDGVIRAVASELARVRHSSRRIVRFDRVMKVYCGMILGYTDRHTVGEYVYLKLKGVVDRAKNVRQTTTRKDLEHAGREVFAEIETRILSMAELGTRVKRSSHREYIRVRARVVERKGVCFLTLGRPGPTGERKVICLETKGSFRRRMATRFNRRQEYRNTPRLDYH